MMRGRIRQVVLLAAVVTAIFLLLSTYNRKSPTVTSTNKNNGDGDSSSSSPEYRTKARPTSLHLIGDNINALMPGLTQPEEHLERMRQHERQMLDNVRDMIRHKERLHSIQINDDVDANKDHRRPPSLWKGMMKNDGSDRSTSKANVVFTLRKRLVHFDLKGARPTMKYMRQLFPFLRSLGATGVLIEYEDQFPYWGRLDDFRAHDSFTVREVRELNNLAADNGLDVIPLVQTFGHMEFVLKRDNFKGLREVPTFPQAICPSRNDTLPLIREMIDQLLSLHPAATHVHIGCDEVYNMGECALCQERMERLHWTTEDLLINHVKSIARHIHETYHLRALIWDDMFRKVSMDSIRQSEIGRYVDVLVWKYQDDIDESLPVEIWNKYSQVFNNGIWIASAFKGASYPDSYATDIDRRLSNHVHWMEVVQKNIGRVQFAGIVLTGWQRFDHFSTLCELMPAGIPSLAINLRYLQSLEWSVNDEERVRQTLGCNLPIPLHLIANGPEMRCNFPGSRVFELVINFHTLVANLQTEFFDSNIIRGWLSEYNLETRFSSPSLLDHASLLHADAQRNLTFFRMAMESALSDIYNRPTVIEWLDTNVKPLARRLQRYNDKIKWLMVPNVWPRRPIELVTEQQSTTTTKRPQRQRLHAMEP